MIERLALLFHPGDASMLRWRDRELGRRRVWWMRLHLSKCESCMERLRKLNEVSVAIDRSLNAPPRKEILLGGRQRLLEELRQFSENNYPISGELLELLIGQVRRCLGAEAARSIEHRARSERDGRQVIYSLDRALRTFLGDRAAVEWQRRFVARLESNARGRAS